MNHNIKEFSLLGEGMVMSLGEYADGSPEWLRARATGLGGSDIAAILGLSPFKGAHDVWLSKVEPERKEDGRTPLRFKVGHALEEIVAAEWVEEMDPRAWHDESVGFLGSKIDGLTIYEERRMFTSTSAPVMRANLDYGLGEGDYKANGPTSFLEIKTTSAFYAHLWADGPPLHYLCQVQWYMRAIGAEFCYLAVLFLGMNRIKWWRIEADHDDQELLVRTAEAWWARHMWGENGPMAPPADGSDGALKVLHRQRQGVEQGEPLDLAHVDHEIEAYLALQSEIKRLEKERARYKNKIIEAMGTSNLGTSSKGRKVKVVTSKKFDEARAREADPELVDAHAIKQLDTRSLKKASPEFYNEHCAPVSTYIRVSGGKP